MLYYVVRLMFYFIFASPFKTIFITVTIVVISFARETLVSLPHNPSTTSVGRDTTLTSTMIGYICL